MDHMKNFEVGGTCGLHGEKHKHKRSRCSQNRDFIILDLEGIGCGLSWPRIGSSCMFL
jgi:hypothetical protein